MQIQWSTISAIISFATLVSVIASPILTAIISNRHQLRMKRLEYYELYRAEALEKYIHSVGAAINTGTNIEEYGKAYGEVFLYAPESLWPTMEFLDGALKCENEKEASILFVEICKELSKNPPRSIKQRRNHKPN